MGIFKRDKKKGMGIGLSDRMLSPRNTEEQESPEPERPTRPDEEAEVAVHQMKEPPQAEG